MVGERGLPQIAPAPVDICSAQAEDASAQPGQRGIFDSGELPFRPGIGQWHQGAAQAGAQIEKTGHFFFAQQFIQCRNCGPVGQLERHLAGQGAAIHQ